jgi:hypothetical protein
LNVKKLLIALVCITTLAHGQKSFFGLEAGSNVANQRVHVDLGFGSSTTAFYKNSVKPAFGAFYELGITDLFAVRAGARYSGLGYADNGGTISKLDINYLTLPFAARYNVTHRLSVCAGPYVSFTLGGTKINNQDITKTYHKNDFGFSLGAEQDVYKNFALGVNYLIGTKNIWLNDANGTFKYTNRALQFILIYKFKKIK